MHPATDKRAYLKSTTYRLIAVNQYGGEVRRDITIKGVP